MALVGKTPTGSFRWRQAADEDAARLFPDEEIVQRHVGAGEYRGLEFFHVNARRVLNEVPRAPFGFRWTVNAYRGCSHACTYCFARPTHTYLGFDMGHDFDTRIVVKVNAVERLRAELRHPRWQGELVAMGTNTDPYQRAEGRYRLTQGLVAVLAEAANPLSLLTKSPLILRDLPLLVAAASRAEVRVNFSVGTLDPDVWRLSEPGAPHPARRLEAVAQLNAAGVPCGVLMGPVLPGLSDGPEQLAEVVEGAVAAGATSVSAVYLHLRGPLYEHVMRWARAERPALAEQWQRLYGGRPNVPRALQRELSGLVAELVADVRRRRPPLTTRAARPPEESPPRSVQPSAARAASTPSPPPVVGAAGGSPAQSAADPVGGPGGVASERAVGSPTRRGRRSSELVAAPLARRRRESPEPVTAPAAGARRASTDRAAAAPVGGRKRASTGRAAVPGGGGERASTGRAAVPGSGGERASPEPVAAGVARSGRAPPAVGPSTVGRARSEQLSLPLGGPPGRQRRETVADQGRAASPMDRQPGRSR